MYGHKTTHSESLITLKSMNRECNKTQRVGMKPYAVCSVHKVVNG